MDQDVQTEPSTSGRSSATGRRGQGRGPNRGVLSAEPMHLEFDAHFNAIGPYSQKYGVHIGNCASRLDINTPSYPKLASTKAQFWEETQVN